MQLEREVTVKYIVCGYDGPEGTYDSLKEARAHKRQLHKDYGIGWIMRDWTEVTTLTELECIEGNPR